ncbi:hypothetical protein [Nonomuraea guangzhouensis]|uniref:Type II toxin-antitoxin system HicA family toxin n=1 Tax=Nonomuraea guangzhouensis TaxID=1291555 RepID=A0ABW4GT77_9ACTN|nr:hypothetical protein [Nonomuraea guangzhouensis]
MCVAGYVRGAGQGGSHYEIVPGGRLRHPSQDDIPAQILIDMLTLGLPVGKPGDAQDAADVERLHDSRDGTGRNALPDPTSLSTGSE